MTLIARPLHPLPRISTTIDIMQGENKDGVVEDNSINEIRNIYRSNSQGIYDTLIDLVQSWGDQPAVRQILYYHYLQGQPLLKEILLENIYPALQEGSYIWNGEEIKSFLHKKGLAEKEQDKSLKCIKNALKEMRFLKESGRGLILKYQRPTVEAVAYALYSEYSEGFDESKRFSLKNPPLEQVRRHAAFPAYFLIDPRTIPMLLEACRIKNYISLESRGGLNQYALIYQDLFELVDYMLGGR